MYHGQVVMRRQLRLFAQRRLSNELSGGAHGPAETAVMAALKALHGEIVQAAL